MISGLPTYLAMVHGVYFPPGQAGYCNLGATVHWTCNMCSTLCIQSMTFDRFFSIIRPHKAASFNTVKRAKFTLIVIILFSILYNIPHFFITDHQNWECLPYGKAMTSVPGLFYFWTSFSIFFVLPFVSLLTMNSFIIHTILNRPIMAQTFQNQGQGQSQGQASKNTEGQMIALLLLVSWVFDFDDSWLCFVFICNASGHIVLTKNVCKLLSFLQCSSKNTVH